MVVGGAGLVPLVVAAAALAAAPTRAESSLHSFFIRGSSPAAIQLASLLSSASRDYLIIESGTQLLEEWERAPRFGKLWATRRHGPLAHVEDDELLTELLWRDELSLLTEPPHAAVAQANQYLVEPDWEPEIEVDALARRRRVRGHDPLCALVSSTACETRVGPVRAAGALLEVGADGRVNASAYVAYLRSVARERVQSVVTNVRPLYVERLPPPARGGGGAEEERGAGRLPARFRVHFEERVGSEWVEIAETLLASVLIDASMPTEVRALPFAWAQDAVEYLSAPTEAAALRGRRVVVVGGGEDALEYALGAAELARSVEVVHVAGFGGTWSAAVAAELWPAWMRVSSLSEREARSGVSPSEAVAGWWGGASVPANVLVVNAGQRQRNESWLRGALRPNATDGSAQEPVWGAFVGNDAEGWCASSRNLGASAAFLKAPGVYGVRACHGPHVEQRAVVRALYRALETRKMSVAALLPLALVDGDVTRRSRTVPVPWVRMPLLEASGVARWLVHRGQSAHGLAQAGGLLSDVVLLHHAPVWSEGRGEGPVLSPSMDVENDAANRVPQHVDVPDQRAWFHLPCAPALDGAFEPVGLRLQGWGAEEVPSETVHGFVRRLAHVSFQTTDEAVPLEYLTVSPVGAGDRRVALRFFLQRRSLPPAIEGGGPRDEGGAEGARDRWTAALEAAYETVLDVDAGSQGTWAASCANRARIVQFLVEVDRVRTRAARVAGNPAAFPDLLPLALSATSSAVDRTADLVRALQHESSLQAAHAIPPPAAALAASAGPFGVPPVCPAHERFVAWARTVAHHLPVRFFRGGQEVLSRPGWDLDLPVHVRDELFADFAHVELWAALSLDPSVATHTARAAHPAAPHAAPAASPAPPAAAAARVVVESLEDEFAAGALAAAATGEGELEELEYAVWDDSDEDEGRGRVAAARHGGGGGGGGGALPEVEIWEVEPVEVHAPVPHERPAFFDPPPVPNGDTNWTESRILRAVRAMAAAAPETLIMVVDTSHVPSSTVAWLRALRAHDGLWSWAVGEGERRLLPPPQDVVDAFGATVWGQMQFEDLSAVLTSVAGETSLRVTATAQALSATLEVARQNDELLRAALGPNLAFQKPTARDSLGQRILLEVVTVPHRQRGGFCPRAQLHAVVPVEHARHAVHVLQLIAHTHMPMEGLVVDPSPPGRPEEHGEEGDFVIVEEDGDAFDSDYGDAPDDDGENEEKPNQVDQDRKERGEESEGPPAFAPPLPTLANPNLFLSAAASSAALSAQFGLPRDRLNALDDL